MMGIGAETLEESADGGTSESDRLALAARGEEGVSPRAARKETP